MVIDLMNAQNAKRTIQDLIECVMKNLSKELWYNIDKTLWLLIYKPNNKIYHKVAYNILDVIAKQFYSIRNLIIEGIEDRKWII